MMIMDRHPDLQCVYKKAQLNEFLEEISSERQPNIDYDAFFRTQVLTDDPLRETWEELQFDYFQPPHRLGLDLARFGTAETVWCRRRGNRILPLIALTGFAGGNGVQILSRTREMMEKMEIECLIVDKTGITGGMAIEDPLINDGYTVVSIGFGEDSSRPDMYRNAATEMWFNIADSIDEMMLPNDPMLITQLTTRKFAFTGKKIRKGTDYAEQRIIEPKDSLKKRNLESPDRADAVCLAFAPIGFLIDEEEFEDSVQGELALPAHSGVIDWND
jgi:hypothetical protein